MTTPLTLKNSLTYKCELCDYSCCVKQSYERHLRAKKHILAIQQRMTTPMTLKNSLTYTCETCDYTCCNYQSYERHMKAEKHILAIQPQTTTPNTLQNKQYNCSNCNKYFKDRAGRWRHQKKCTKDMQTNINERLNVDEETTGSLHNSSDIPIELILEVIKQSKEVQNVLIEQNKELQKQLLEQNEKMLEQSDKHHKQILEIVKKPNIINTNSNNKTAFNLQFFLNETCKDAMNIVDFVNSLQLTNNDFETTGKLLSLIHI